MNSILGIVSNSAGSYEISTFKTKCGIDTQRRLKTQNILETEFACFGIRVVNSTDKNAAIRELFSNQRKSILIVGDFSIYNREKIRRNLENEGFRFRTYSSAETIFRLYESSGVDGFLELRGDYAFTVWDQKLRKLFLIRDRFGIKPLFYAWSGQVGDPLLFSSEVSTLMKSGLVTMELDCEAIYHYLFLTFFPQPYTPIKKIRSVRPGHYILFEPNRGYLREVEYWDIPCTDRKRVMAESEVIENCGRLLDEAVRLRCQGTEGATAISLSSGIDSSAVAGFVSKYTDNVMSFTFGFESEYEHLNEFGLSRLVAEKILCRHLEITVTPDQMLECIQRVSEITDTPTVGMFLPYLFGVVASAHGISEAFRGDGGNSGFQYLIDRGMVTLDKIFGVLDILPPNCRVKLYESLDSLTSKMSRSSVTPGDKLCGFLGFLSSFFAVKDGTTHFAQMFTRGERKRFFRTGWIESPDFVDTNLLVLSYYDGEAKDFYERFNYGDYRVYYDQGLAHLVPVLKSCGVNLKLPYFDHKLVEFIQSTVPSSLREKGGIDKYILKSISGKMLPREILEKRARGFYMPIHEWLEGPLKPLIHDVFSESGLGQRDFLDKQAVKGIYKDYYEGGKGRSSWRKLMVFVMLELWLRSHYDV